VTCEDCFKKSFIKPQTIKQQSMKRTIVLFTVLLLSSVLTFAQNRTISGMVNDETGNPIPFATITEAGTKNATIADAQGNFILKMKGQGSITLTATGFNPETVVPQGNTVKLVMKRNNSELTAVVVTTALGIKRSVRSTGYSVTSIPTASITQARATNLANGLSGKVAGLAVFTVNNGVNPSTRIVLRGERSILGNNQAAIVLDNIPVTSDYIQSINPDDIVSTTILKGANAAALYGSSAANGVIILTSNKGQKGKPRISLTQSTTIENISFFPKFQTRFGAASTEGDFLDPVTGYFPHVPYENQQYGAEYNGATLPLGVPVQYTDASGNLRDTMQRVVYSNKNAIKKFFVTGLTTQNGISYSDGDDHGTFYLSGQYVNTTGTIVNDKSERSVARMGATRNYGRFSASGAVSYTSFNTNVAGGDYNQGRPAYWNALNTPGEIDIRAYKDVNSLFGQESNFYNAYYPNPYWQIYNSRIITRRQDLLANAELNFKASEWANLTYRIGIASTNYQDKATKAGVIFSDYAISDPAGASNSASGFPNGVTPKEGDDLSIYSTVQSDFLATFNKKVLHNDVEIKLIVGGTVNQFTSRFASVGGGQSATTQLQIPGLYNVSNVIGVPSVTEGKVQTGTYGAFGDLQLSYKNFLFLEATGRNDWVSVLAPANRSFFYPGINGSFVFTDAFSGIKNTLPWLSFGKLTASYTKVGTVSLGAYQLSNTFAQLGGFPYGSLTGFGLGTNLANSGIKPEFTAAQEYSIHLTMFKSKVNFEATYYNENVSNEVVPVSLSSSTGFLSTTENLPGLIHNSGVELTGDITPLFNLGPVEWSVGANASFMQSSVGSDIAPILIGGYGLGAVYTEHGKPIRELKVVDWKRDSLGRVIVDPKTGYPSADPTLKDAGRATPAVILGVNTSFKYKGLTLNLQGEYRGGYNVFQFIGNAMAFTGTSAVTAVAGRGKFIYPNSVIPDGNGKYIPNTTVAIQDGATGAGFWASKYNSVGSPYVASGAFWRVREVSISYAVPMRATSAVKGLNISLVARNLFTFLPKDNPYADPEYSQFGTGNAQSVSNENLTPPTRIFGASVNVVF
jgi:TonB-linked SusC/RagA family outer membrane protein